MSVSMDQLLLLKGAGSVEDPALSELGLYYLTFFLIKSLIVGIVFY
jgi:hypothetical protein